MRPRRYPRLLLTLLVAGLAGCATPASRISDAKTVYDGYPPEVQQKIAAGEVAVGFTQEQARMALGEPARKYTRTTTSGTAEIWGYNRTGPTYSFALGSGFGLGSSGFGSIGLNTGTADDDVQEKMRLVFEGGKLTALERAIK